ncbi:MAG: hypothetical protein R2769_09830 [Saprospiraceae bacterium]
MPPRKVVFGHFVDTKSAERCQWRKITLLFIAKTFALIIPFSNGISSVGVVGNPEFFRNMKKRPQ